MQGSNVMAKYTAVRQLKGLYGNARPGDEIEIADAKVAEDLESRGLIVRGHKKVTEAVVAKAEEKRAEPQKPVATEETKATGPKSNK
jgi:hypothetical protein